MNILTGAEIAIIQLRVQLAKKYVEEWGTRWRDDNGRFASPGATGGKSPGATLVPKESSSSAEAETGLTVDQAAAIAEDVSRAVSGNPTGLLPPQVEIAVRLFIAGIWAVKKVERHLDDIGRQLRDAPENLELLTHDDPLEVKPDWEATPGDSEKGDEVLRAAGVTASVNDMAREMYRDSKPRKIHKAVWELISTLPRRRAAMNLLKRRDEIGKLQAELEAIPWFVANNKKGIQFSQKREELQNQLAWRVAEIKAEARFGKFANDSYVSGEGYEELIQELQKNSKDKKTAPPTLFGGSDPVSDRIKREIKKYGYYPYTPVDAPDQPNEGIKDALTSFDKLTNADLSKVRAANIYTITGRKKRAFQHDIDRTTAVINIGPVGESFSTEMTASLNPYKAVVYHELGHALEAQKGTGKVSYQFIRDRDAEFYDNGERPLSEDNPAYSGSNESAYFDKFYNPYVGKSYMGLDRPNTEVVSMAVQRLAGPSPMADMVYRDREHLMYALSVLSQ